MGQSRPFIFPPEDFLNVIDTPSPKTSSSIFYALLPTIVQTRIPQIPSLRRSLSDYSMRQQVQRTPRHQRYQSVDATDYEVSPTGSNTDSRSSIACSETIEPRMNTTDKSAETTTGWKYANQGFALLESAVSEARYPHPANQAFSRQLYIHALTYLMRGLPTDLTPAETLTLQSSIPPSIIESSQASHNPQFDRKSSSTSSSPSLIHRLLASTIIHLCLLVSLLLPYIHSLARAAYQYDKTHHVSESVLAAAVDLTRKSTETTGTLFLKLVNENGKVKQFVLATVWWWVKGVSGGLKEGVGQGLVVLGADGKGGGVLNVGGN
ncbi:hypothetical protein MMC09_000761 [Bachmanniomyces sp. S44760]|nr:hypothetical protein [Bachmanniomyces sp. S44760]